MSKQFLGSAKEFTFSNGGKIYKLALGPKDRELLKDYMEGKTDWFNFVLGGLDKKPYLEVDQWKPKEKQLEKSEKSDLPF